MREGAGVSRGHAQFPLSHLLFVGRLERRQKVFSVVRFEVEDWDGDLSKLRRNRRDGSYSRSRRR
jgi:hypothetical protein